MTIGGAGREVLAEVDAADAELAGEGRADFFLRELGTLRIGRGLGGSRLR